MARTSDRGMRIVCWCRRIHAGGVLLAAVASATLLTRPAFAQTLTPILVDRHVTATSGATMTTAAGEALARLEDAVVPHRLFAERGVSRRAANITYRLFKLAYLDVPQESLLLVANHEIFGHGARLRERFDGPIRYRIDGPAPYGEGGGSTSFEFDREPGIVELLAVTTGGMEASGVAAAQVAERAFARGGMHPRDAMRYLGFELDTLSYVQGTGDGPEEPGHDVSAFLEIYNEVAAATGAPLRTARDLRRQAWVSLANPMVAYAIVGVGRYLWNGAMEMPVPLLQVAGVRYLPMLRYRLTPVGTEVVIANQFGGRLPSTQVDVRIGRAPDARPWGIAVRQRRTTSFRSWVVGLGGDVWRQPWAAGTLAEVEDGGWGGAVRARVERSFGTTQRAGPMAVIADVAVKTAGFVPGDPLGAGLVARVGVGVPLGR